MSSSRTLLIGGAVIAVLGLSGGFFVARMFDPHRAIEPARPSDDAESAAHGEESFVKLKPADAPAAGVELARVERGGGADLLLPGRVAMAANAQSTIGAPLDGVVMQLHVAPGSRAVRGTAIASIRSEDGAAARARQDAARAALDLAEAAERRDASLLEQGAISRQQMETTHAATLKAQADLRAADGAVAAIGSPDAAGVVVVRSPIEGTVMRLSTAPGAVLDEGDEIALIVDPSRTELMFDAPPADAGAVRVGARIEARAASGGAFEAEVIGVGPGAPGGGATVRAKALGVAPPSGTVLSGRLSGGGDALTVPSEAVQTLDGSSVVFVAEAEGFRARKVVAGRVSAGRTEIASGLSGEEQIAGVGAFLLKAELGKAEAEHDD